MNTQENSIELRPYYWLARLWLERPWDRGWSGTDDPTELVEGVLNGRIEAQAMWFDQELRNAISRENPELELLT